VNLKLHLTHDTDLRAHGFIVGSDLFAEVCWKRPIPDGRLDEGQPVGHSRSHAAAG
jgi:hypothetical protein